MDTPIHTHLSSFRHTHTHTRSNRHARTVGEGDNAAVQHPVMSISRQTSYLCTASLRDEKWKRGVDVVLAHSNWKIGDQV